MREFIFLTAIIVFGVFLIYCLYKQRNNKIVFLLSSIFVFAAMVAYLYQNAELPIVPISYFGKIETIASILP